MASSPRDRGDSVHRAGGAATLVFAVAFIGHFWLETVRGSLGFVDADNPVHMLAFLRERPDLFTYSGLLFVVMGLCLVLTVLTTWEAFDRRGSTSFRFACLLGLFAAASFFANGVLRVQAPGTLIHMQGIEPGFGYAGYLAVQMAGTQGFASAGGFALAIWIVALSIDNVSHRRVWIGTSWLGLGGVATLLAGLIGPLFPSSGLVYPGFLLGLASTALWCLLFGLQLLLTGDIQRPTHVDVDGSVLSGASPEP